MMNNSSIQLSPSGSHLKNVGKMFRKLYEDEQLTDVVLCCEDGSIRAHKVILASCSPYFHKIFTETNVCGDLSIVIMHEVPFQHLQDLIELIYKGNVELLPESLNSLYELAKEFQLNGISGILSEYINANHKQPSSEIVTPTLTPIGNTIYEEGEEESPIAEELNQKSLYNNEESPILSASREISPLPFIISDVCSADNSTPELGYHPISICDKNPRLNLMKHGDNVISENYDLDDLAAPLQQREDSVENEKECAPQESKIKIVEHIVINESDYDLHVEESAGEFLLSGISDIQKENNNENHKQTSETSKNNEVSHRYDTRLKGLKKVAVEFEGNSSKRTKKSSDAPIIIEIDKNTALSDEEEESTKALELDKNSVSNNEESPKLSTIVHPRIHRKFKCDVCPRSFIRAALLSRHQSVHMGERPYPCTQCDKAFSSCDALKIHTESDHNKNRKAFKCKLCPRSFMFRGNLSRHQLTHSGERPFPCTQCDKAFSRSDALKIHTGSVHSKNKKPFKCELCPRSFKRHTKLIRHQMVHRAKRRYPCTQCDKTYQNSSLLKEHLMKAHDEKLLADEEHRRTLRAQAYKCEICNLSFKFPSFLTQHNKSHHASESSYACTKCDKAFSSCDALKVHTESVHNTNRKPFKCELCPRSFKRHTKLIRHQMVHRAKRRYPCTQCDKTYQNSSLLREHLMKDHDEKLLANEEHRRKLRAHTNKCHLSFKFPSSLTQHNKRHRTGERAYACTKCSMSFKFRSLLTRHELVHSGERPYTCSQCHKSFMFPWNLTRHELTHTDERPYACTQCDETFDRYYRLKEHMTFAHVKKPANKTRVKKWKCAVCHKSFMFRYILTRHELVHSGERPHVCSHCQKRFPWNLTRHELTHTDERPYACTQCDETFDRYYRLKEHMTFAHDKETATKTRVKKWKCAVCHKSFKFRWVLTRHELTHTDERSYPCTQCDKILSRLDSLKKHVRIVHDKKSRVKKLKCEVCDKSFKFRSLLTRHELIHTDERPYPCSQCDKIFSSLDNLKEHVRVVHDKKSRLKKWKCEVCDKSFRFRWNLTRHEMVHSGERPYACTQCQKSFMFRWNLTRHEMSKHSSQRPYACIQCDKTFGSPYILNDHVRFAHGKKSDNKARVKKSDNKARVKKWKCEECNKSFMFRYNLNRHELTHSGERCHPCTQCDKSFTFRWNLTRHELTHSGESPYACTQCHESFNSLTKLTRHKLVHTGESPCATNPYKLRDHVRKAHQHYNESSDEESEIRADTIVSHESTADHSSPKLGGDLTCEK